MRHTFQIVVGLPILTSLLLGSQPSAASVQFLTERLDGPQSRYTDSLLRMANEWPAARKFCDLEMNATDIKSIGIKTEGRPYYVGFKKCMVIKAPLKAVAAVIDDAEHYGSLFPGFEKVEVVGKSPHRTIVSWERAIPVIFVPNIRYEINYLAEVMSPTRKFYRYQFRKGDRLRFNDGLEVLDEISPTTTLFTNYEFYEADYGIGIFGIKAASAETVWKESLKGGVLSLLSIRLKSEHPDWNYPKVAQERMTQLPQFDVATIRYETEKKEEAVPISRNGH